MISVVLSLVLATASAADPQAELTKGIVAFGHGDLQSARKHLDDAEAQTTDPALLARIHRQRGIIAQVEGKRRDSVVSFLRALDFDPKVELSDREHKGEVQRLFACAKTLGESGLDEKAIEAKDFESASWSCPIVDKPPSVPPPPPLVPPPAEAEESESIVSSPWLWIGVAAGVAVIAGATTAGVLLAGGEDPYGGTSRINIRLER